MSYPFRPGFQRSKDQRNQLLQAGRRFCCEGQWGASDQGAGGGGGHFLSAHALDMKAGGRHYDAKKSREIIAGATRVYNPPLFLLFLSSPKEIGRKHLLDGDTMAYAQQVVV